MTLIERLKDDLEWAEANEWEAPIMLADDLREAINELAWWKNHTMLIPCDDWRYPTIECKGE